LDFLKEWGVTLHKLPHSYAIMLASNVHPKIVRERLGHSSIAITMDIYSHLMPNMQEGAAAAVDGVTRRSTLSALAQGTISRQLAPTPARRSQRRSPPEQSRT
jgi:site-specific recombinase XerC